MREFIGYQRGINLGGWLSQCNYTIERYETFITEEDFKRFSKWDKSREEWHREAELPWALPTARIKGRLPPKEAKGRSRGTPSAQKERGARR